MLQSSPQQKPAPLNLDPFTLDGKDLAAEFPTARPRHLRGRPAGAFLAGPLCWTQLDQAAALPGRALLLWLILVHRARLSRSKARTVHVCLKRIGAGHGLNESASRRALRSLERAGLVTVVRHPGQALEVMLQDPPTAAENKP
jgi:hypothetical protein